MAQEYVMRLLILFVTLAGAGILAVGALWCLDHASRSSSRLRAIGFVVGLCLVPGGLLLLFFWLADAIRQVP